MRNNIEIIQEETIKAETLVPALPPENKTQPETKVNIPLSFTKNTAQQAIIYSVILGSPKASKYLFKPFKAE